MTSIRSLPVAPLCILCLSCTLSVGLVGIRVQATSKISYFLLIWNLFLACVPVLFAVLAFLARGDSLSARAMVWSSMAGWLVFFPNAPYIITDFLHLKPRAPVPLWFDTLLLFSFAWNGIMAGFISLRLMHLVVERTIGRMAGWLFVFAVCPVAAFGVFLGRFLRWNSWDVIRNPFPLLGDLLEIASSGGSFKGQLALVGVITPFLFVAYLSMVSFQSLRHSPETEERR